MYWQARAGNQQACQKSPATGKLSLAFTFFGDRINPPYRALKAHPIITTRRLTAMWHPLSSLIRAVRDPQDDLGISKLIVIDDEVIVGEDVQVAAIYGVRIGDTQPVPDL